MGYRSDVTILIHEKDWAVIKADALIQDVYIDFYETLDENLTKDNRKVFQIKYAWVKWYPDYEDVSFLTKHFERLLDEADDFALIRVGEDATDMETLQTGELYLWPVVAVESEINI